jgi:hypothetical protein
MRCPGDGGLSASGWARREKGGCGPRGCSSTATALSGPVQVHDDRVQRRPDPIGIEQLRTHPRASPTAQSPRPPPAHAPMGGARSTGSRPAPRSPAHGQLGHITHRAGLIVISRILNRELQRATTGNAPVSSPPTDLRTAQVASHPSTLPVLPAHGRPDALINPEDPRVRKTGLG